MEIEHEQAAERPPDDRTRPTAGDVVELLLHGRTLRTGAVEAVMPDGTGFWLAADGIDTRLYVHTREDGLELRIRP